jgi:acyl-CoA reductase-like NAD-dependent aldehyde dehydrogenase
LGAGETIGKVSFGSIEDYANTLVAMDEAKKTWMLTPAPIRGEVVRKIGEKLRARKHDLAMMISIEMGKIFTESRGENQESIVIFV